MAERGSGTTTAQMLNAPRGAIYVWVNAAMRYPRDLAAKLGRQDLRIIPVDDLRWERLAGLNLPLVLDHAADPNSEQWRVLFDYRARLNRAPKSPPTEGGE